ncbi:hypothetical protein GCM10011507_29890 [Edaphobacter acidisoli]|uniref:DUF2029 domain-containing protein n=2 Tax=Edaphobacter acidisoli TaxID=2040573 RepID=A0A916W8V0_9BACT|nr:hypothetical protein GCM10011507_29890 [Edaphobacter acidisoli]
MRNGGSAGWIQRIVLVLLGMAALVSLAIGIHHAMEFGSHDMQWMAARLVGQHMDPWQEELAHGPHHYAHFGPPNYLHFLYLLLLPMGALNFPAAQALWTVGIICMSLASMWVLRKLFNLSGFQTALALCLLWMSSPFRVVIEVGQMSFFELFFLAGAYLAVSQAVGGVSFGVSLVKYSFSPSAAMLFLLRGRFRFLAYAALVCIVGLVGVWAFIRTPMTQLALEPFTVSALPTAVSPGFADLMTLAEHTLKFYVPIESARHISYLLGLIGSAAYALLLSRFRLSRSAEFTLISVASLFFVKHLSYDYIFLVVLLCFALTQTSVKAKGVLAAGVMAFWFVLPYFARKTQNDPNVHLGQLATNCCLLAALLVFTTYVVLTDAAQKADGRASEETVATTANL